MNNNVNMKKNDDMKSQKSRIKTGKIEKCASHDKLVPPLLKNIPFGRH